MKRRNTILAGALALALSTGAPALAQEQEQEPAAEVAEATAMLLEKFEVLREGLGIDVPLLPQASLSNALSAALPILPNDDPSLSWSSSFAFDFKIDRATGDLEPDEEGRTVLTDARACLEPDEIGEVVHFQRFARGEVRGHRCIISFGAADGGSAWVLQSRTFAEGPRRRLSAYYGVATAIEGDRDRARQVLEARLDQNVALAGIMADYALAMFLETEAPAEPLTTENFQERLTRLQTRLAEVAEGSDAPAPSPEPDASVPVD